MSSSSANDGDRGESLAIAVVDAVAEAAGCDPIQLDPLYDAVDPDALNALFDGRRETTGQFRFEYHGYTVVVDANGCVTLEDGHDV
ncbi:HalOD1 output domain-containing protein [Halovivax cerinus]|uniref:HalOD1 output domain-containing protein n=1 Tax=Halovivax cerinus TaxID=1487865 RepID=A0ABD5NRC0_9EURY|nr:HalOD1 output domain-containing protein [Halovivax cerinus]